MAALKATPNKSGVASWRVAAVTDLKDEASLALQEGGQGKIPAGELNWARQRLKAGDIVYVEPMTGEGATAGSYSLREVPVANGAIVAIDPSSTDTCWRSGGFSYGSEFDRATQAMRQPGSTFKPFVYATALDHGYTPVTKSSMPPLPRRKGPVLPLWTPENYEAGEYLGPTPLRRGVELSRNLMTARLANTIGMTPIAQTVERMGVYDKLPRYLANSLGSQVTTLLRLTTGYAEFVNGGRKLEATLIDRVQDRHGKTVYRFDKRVCPDCSQAEWQGQEEPLLDENQQQVLDPRTAYQIVSILEGVVQRGTGVAVKAVGKPLAGKTGTSSDFRDAWSVGGSPDLAVGVFIRLGQFPESLAGWRAGRAGGGADFPRLHEGGVGRSAGDALPHSARHRAGSHQSLQRHRRRAGFAGVDPGSVQERHRAWRGLSAVRHRGSGRRRARFGHHGRGRDAAGGHAGRGFRSAHRHDRHRHRRALLGGTIFIASIDVSARAQRIVCVKEISSLRRVPWERDRDNDSRHSTCRRRARSRNRCTEPSPFRSLVKHADADKGPTLRPCADDSSR